MKKIFKLSFVVALLASIVSCDMDLRPINVIDPDNALTTIDDAQKLRAGLYIAFRGYTGGGLMSSFELQTDLFHATTSFGNRGGDVYEWTYTTGFGSAESVWAGCYSNLKNVNYFLQEAAEVDQSDWTDEDKAQLQVFVGEAHFMRAYYHHLLVERFCYAYNEGANKDEFGVPYVTVYAPTSASSKYPGRGTLEAAYTNIIEDLDMAAQKITTTPAEGAIYITSDLVKAFQARVALYMGDYTTAISKAKSLIDGGRYPLINSAAGLKAMFIDDNGKECLWLSDADLATSSLPPSNDYAYLSYDANQGIYKPDYVPAKWVLDMYEDSDLRKALFFDEKTISITGGSTYDLFVFNKFPGNPALRTSESNQNYCHKTKIFRIAEMHLILAEAYARSGQDANAIAALNVLRTARGAAAYTSGNLLDEILKERTRELIGEGFRFFDLKRYGKDIQRSAAQVRSAIYLPDTYEQFHKASTDFRFLWPIPQAEIDANPQIKNQQNPGYSGN